MPDLLTVSSALSPHLRQPTSYSSEMREALDKAFKDTSWAHAFEKPKS